MSFKVNRNGNFQIGNTASGGSPVSGTIKITENGEYDVSTYAQANVQTPVPSGKITITENGSDINVSDYATADVDVQVSGGIIVTQTNDISSGTLNSAEFTLSDDIVAEVPDGVTTIGGGAFSDNVLITKVIMSDDVITINDGAPWMNVKGSFYNCINLKTVEFSNSLEKIGDYAFSNCKSITNISIPNSCKEIGDGAFNTCVSLTRIVIPLNVTAVSDDVFNNDSSLTTVVIPNGVTNIGNRAFKYCTALTSINIPNNVTSIGDEAFESCESLSSLIIPSSVNSFGDNAFISAGLTDIYYTGTQTEWEQITGLSGAGIPQGCTIHYEYTPS